MHLRDFWAYLSDYQKFDTLNNISPSSRDKLLQELLWQFRRRYPALHRWNSLSTMSPLISSSRDRHLLKLRALSTSWSGKMSYPMPKDDGMYGFDFPNPNFTMPNKKCHF